MLGNLNQSRLATICSPPQVPCFLSHGKTQFLMSYWSMYISRFMGVCHSNEAKIGLKKIQE